nr:hypothetical protein [Tanacetum cinerariifolium]
MDMTIDQQVALDEALVPHASRLRIGKSNFRLRSDISSNESTLQLVYDVLRLTPFYKAFLVTAYVKEIYMQEFWAPATVHHHSIRFKMDNKKRIVNLEYFREMMHICPRLPGQTFDDLLFKEEILAFLSFLRYSREIRKLTDVNINKLHQPWRSFTAIINKCLSGKSTGYDSLRLSQAQILWGLYHKKNVDFAYLLWEDFIYQVEHKDAKKGNEMYYPRFTNVIIHYFMNKDPSIPIRNKVNWHYVRDDQMFTMIKLVSKHQNTQQFAPPKTKASVRNTESSSDTTVTPPTAAAGTRLSTSTKGKQPTKASKAKGLTMLSEVAMTEAEQLNLAMKRSMLQTHISQASSSGTDEGIGIIPGDDDDDQDEGDDDDDQDEGNDDDQDSDKEGEEFIHPKLSIHEKEEINMRKALIPSLKHLKTRMMKVIDDENLGLNVGREEGQDKEDDEDELYRDVNINLEGRVVQMADVHTTQEFEDTHVTLTPLILMTTSHMDVSAPTTVASLTLFAPTLTPSTIATISTVPQASTPPTTASNTLLQDLLNFGSLFGFNHRFKTLEANFSEFVQTNQFAGAVSSIPRIVQRYMDQRMNKAVNVAVQIQSDRLCDKAQAENEEFLKNLDENIQKIIKEQVKDQVKVQVSKILLKIEKNVNEQLEAKVLTQSSNSSKTSYVVTTDLSEMELKNILIEKMEGNKSIYRSDEQRNLYKALVKAYESDKIILDTYEDIVMLKSRRDDDVDKDEEPFAGLDRGSKRRREGKEPESTRTPKEKATRTAGKSTQGIQLWISELAKQAEFCSSFNELMDTPVDFSAFLMNRLKVDTLTLELLAGLTYELMKGSCKSLVELEFFLDEIMGTSSGLKAWCLAQCGVKNRESARDVYSKCRIIAVTELQIVERHNYKHLDWIMVRRDDDKLYKFKEGDFKRLRIQDTEDMLLLLVQGKLTNLTVEELFAFNVFLRMFKRSIVIQRHVEDLQLCVESYQKKLNLTNPDTDGTLNDIRTALHDRLKGIQMKYLPQTIWRKCDKERVTAMIQAIDKQLKTRRIMRSLEKFVGGRLYEGDFKML